MLLTITNTQPPATDLGYLLGKHPERCQSFELPYGQAHVFYPEAAPERCTAALLLEVDPIALARRRRGGAPLAAYVSDRPYVASSLLCVAIAQVFRSALSGRCNDRPELAAAALPLTVRLAAVPCHGGEGVLRRLFEPLGYSVSARQHPLDDEYPSWGPSPYFTVTLQTERPLSECLTHLYVLIPVLDAEKHYWVGKDEVEKLLRKGAGWLPAHPECRLIAHRYLARQRSLALEALRRLADEDAPQAEVAGESGAASVLAPEQRLSLRQQRRAAVVGALKEVGAASVIDLGCGEGYLLRALLRVKGLRRIAGMDVSSHVLARARARLRIDRLPPAQRERIELFHGSLTYRDRRLAGYDAATIAEVIEHLDPPRLAAMERVLFEFARPGAIVLTTPNREYNALYPQLRPDGLRHPDHRFEWTRQEFEAWARAAAERNGYRLEIRPVGPEDPTCGTPTQMGVFRR